MFRYLSLGLDVCHSDQRVQGEVPAVLLVHLGLHPACGVVHLLGHPGHLQLIQVTVLLVLGGEAEARTAC